MVIVLIAVTLTVTVVDNQCFGLIIILPGTLETYVTLVHFQCKN